jgi:hypothetical protein
MKGKLLFFVLLQPRLHVLQWNTMTYLLCCVLVSDLNEHILYNFHLTYPYPSFHRFTIPPLSPFHHRSTTITTPPLHRVVTLLKCAIGRIVRFAFFSVGVVTQKSNYS